VKRFYLKTSLRHHTTGNGRIDSSRKHKQTSARRTNGESSRTRLLTGTYVCVGVSDLNGHRHS
jgi:hypothetical protein